MSAMIPGIAPREVVEPIGRCFLNFEQNSRQHFSSLSQFAALRDRGRIYYAKFDPNLAIADLLPGDGWTLLREGIQAVPGIQFRPTIETEADQMREPPPLKSLNEVLVHSGADLAWRHATGKGVHIAILDSGICGGMLEFPAWKRSPHQRGEDNWADPSGHGSMVACIAAGTKREGGRYSGVAPDAKIISCQSNRHDTDLYEIYEYLLTLVDQKLVDRLVVNNSYFRRSPVPPPIDGADYLAKIIRMAVDRGVVVIFAAGNNHVKVGGHDPAACSPDSIWGVNSLDEVITVGTVDENNRMDCPPATPGRLSHCDSSRGPGQLSRTASKPDCVAPTYGEVMWGCGYRTMFWGTSGAAPQVAGLAALLLEKDPTLTPAEVQRVIRTSATGLPIPSTCVGAGLIDCNKAITSLL